MGMKTPGDQFIGLRTVLSLTRTSRALHEHAADALWDTIPGFGILVYSLPREFWRPSSVGGPAGPIELALIANRPLEDVDLLRFNHYAPRVKRILLPSACLHLPPSTRALSFSPNILDAFESRPYGWVLPNLRVLCCSPELRHYADFYRSFSVVYGPNIQEVYTQCPYVNHTAPKVVEGHWKETLARLHALAPNLSSLNLNANDQPFGLTISSLLSSVVAATSQNLRVLRLSHLPINLNAVQHLATLPFLTELAAKLDEDIAANDLVLLFKPGNACFPALGELHLFHSHDLFLLTLFIHLTRPANARLRIITLYILEALVPFNLVTNLLDDILEHEHVRSFTAISLNCFIDPQSPGPHVLTEAHLRPFFKLKELRCFQLGIRCDFDIDNRTLKKVVAVWPNLTVLILGPSLTAKTSKITLNGLIPLVLGCPHLKTLGLTIDATVYMAGPVDLNGTYGSWLLHGPTVNVDLSMMPKEVLDIPKSFKLKIPALYMLQSPLEELILGRSRIHNPAAVAGVLSCFFPKLKYIRGTWRHAEVLGLDNAVFSEEETREIIEESECGHAWQSVVNKILPAMVRTRKHERNARRLAERRGPTVA
ncbi:hypothetical protein GSI_15339 [Ganoderma sinense ZZ0214-1]|uniref:Uncharacterized protein n=1 Tax=Ganoderma sinense ZZ0214-1 TaxID=1077348 RepID=A0A2G8RMA1_9APHY|nr:hypothetical protein GSI_15339 [Ganoderma sinense ZZ0214-1]